MDLTQIENPDFLKRLTKRELKQLAEEIRSFLIEKISVTGGHLASNLGAVELTIALHYVFNSPKDKLIFDVGHQSYTHKILTGRAKDFEKLRKLDGLSGYVSRDESEHDIWESGHSSTSISAQCGLLLAQKYNGDEGRIVSVIGDSAIANGVAFEALNYVGRCQEYRPIIILNDNKMGISKSVGSLSNQLNSLRVSTLWRKLKVIMNKIFPAFLTNFFHRFKRGLKGFFQADNIFEDLGLDYFGPYDGNDIVTVIKALEKAKKVKGPCLIHLTTKKGKGYSYAENDENGSYHGVGAFDPETGQAVKAEGKRSFSEIVSDHLLQLRKKQPFYVVCPAMISGAKLEKFLETYPADLIDVGISEEHATTMAAGIALSGVRVVLMMYSTFSQRAYDFFLNDIARQNLPVVVCIDRAGVVGEDGSTHQGLYDVSMFAAMPNFMIAMPRNAAETRGILDYSMTLKQPIVVRYPRNSVEDRMEVTKIVNERWEIIRKGKRGVVISYGPDLERILKISNDYSINVTIVNARFICPLDEAYLRSLCPKTPILVYEQVVKQGSLGMMIAAYNEEHALGYGPIQMMSFDTNDIVTFGAIPKVLDRYHLGDQDLLEAMRRLYENR